MNNNSIYKHRKHQIMVLFLFSLVFCSGQNKLDTTFKKFGLISVKSGTSFNNNSFSKNFIRSELGLHPIITKYDSVGFFLVEKNRFTTNPYFSIGVRTQTKKSAGFYFGFAYTSFKNVVFYKKDVYLNEFFDGTNYHYSYLENRGNGFVINDVYRLELHLFKVYKNVHFEVGLINGDLRISRLKVDVEESAFSVVSSSKISPNSKLNYGEPKTIVSKQFENQMEYKLKKNCLAPMPFIPISAGVEYFMDVKNIKISIGTRIVYSWLNRYVAYQINLGVHFKSKWKKS